jgi:hypothetical protein
LYLKYKLEKIHGECLHSWGTSKSRGLHKAFNKGGIPFLVVSFSSPQINKCTKKSGYSKKYQKRLSQNMHSEFTAYNCRIQMWGYIII